MAARRVSIRREDAEHFIEEVGRDDPETRKVRRIGERGYGLLKR